MAASTGVAGEQQQGGVAGGGAGRKQRADPAAADPAELDLGRCERGGRAGQPDVTGAASGIGRATARRLYAEGATVILLDRDTGLLDGVTAELGDRAEAVNCDVADHAGVAAVIGDVSARHGRLAVLVAAAGVDQCDTVPNTTIEQWRTIIDVDLDGVFYACRAAIPVMAARGSGAIVTISSAIGTVGERNRSEGIFRLVVSSAVTKVPLLGDEIRAPNRSAERRDLPPALRPPRSTSAVPLVRHLAQLSSPLEHDGR